MSAVATARATAATLHRQKMRCGGMESVDGGDLSSPLPPRAVVRSDEHGPATECRVDGEGNKVKAAVANRARKIAHPPLSGCAIESRSCPKFGKSVKEDVDSHIISTEEITVAHPRAQGRKAEEPAASGGSHAVARKGIKVCKTCGKKGDHWTSKCQSEGLAPRTHAFVDCTPTADGPAAVDGAGKEAYVPPSRRRAVCLVGWAVEIMIPLFESPISPRRPVNLISLISSAHLASSVVSTLLWMRRLD